MSSEEDFSILVNNEVPPDNESLRNVPPDYATATEELPGDTPPPSYNTATQQQGQDNSAPQDDQSHTRVAAGGNVPVYYSTGTGVRVVNQPVVFADPLGSSVIITPEQDDMHPAERPLREKDLRFLKIFATVTIFLFPPTGIAGLIVAFQCEREFHKGIERGDLDVARRKAKLCERFILVSLVLGLVMYVLIFALVERQVVSHHDSATYRGLGHWTR